MEGFTCRERRGGLHLVREGYEEPLDRVGLLRPEGPTISHEKVSFDGGRGCPQVYALPDRERVVVRTYHHGGLLRGLLRTAFTDRRRAWRELALMERLHRWGVPTLRGVAALAHRLLPGLYRLQLVTREERGARDLLTWLDEGPPAAERRQVLAEAGRVVRRLHDHNVAHADLHPRNLLVTAEEPPRVLVIDLDQSRERTHLATGERLGALARMERFLRKQTRRRDLRLRATDRLRFCRGYYRADDPGRREELRAVARRVARGLPLHRWWWWLEGLFSSRR